MTSRIRSIVGVAVFAAVGLLSSAATAHTASKVDSPRLEVGSDAFRVGDRTLKFDASEIESSAVFDKLLDPLKSLRGPLTQPELLLDVDPDASYQMLTIGLHTAASAGWHDFALRIGDNPVVSLAIPTNNTGKCFDRADEETDRERCWQQVGGRKTLALSVLVTDAGIQLHRDGEPVDVQDDCQEASICPTDAESDDKSGGAHDWRTLYHQLRATRDDVDDSKLPYRDPDQIIVTLAPDTPAATLRDVFLANCKLDESEYDSRDAYEKALPDHCHDRLFPEIQLGAPKSS